MVELLTFSTVVVEVYDPVLKETDLLVTRADTLACEENESVVVCFDVLSVPGSDVRFLVAAVVITP